MNEQKAASLLWAITLGLLSISTVLLVYLVIDKTTVPQPNDVYQYLQDHQVFVVDRADPWTGTDMKAFAELNNLKMPVK